MNRNFTLIFSAVLVVVLLAIWLYLAFFSNRSADDGVIEGSGTFTEFDSLTGSETDSFNNSDQIDTRQQLDENGEIVWPILRQLTSRHVAGYQEIEQASSTKVIFAESGVGHIYSIDLATGEEERVSVTTVPDTREVAFSQDGKYVVFKTGTSVGINPISVGEIDYEAKLVDTTLVEERVGDFTITMDGYLVFGSVTNNSVVVQSLKLGTNDIEVLFTVPFREASILFADTIEGLHYFLPKTSYALEGFVYEVDGSSGKFTRLDIDGFGFVSSRAGDYLVSTYREQSNVITEMYNTKTKEVVVPEMPLLPQKCISLDTEMYCALPGNKKLQYNSIDQWLKGVDSYSDNLRHVGESLREMINITGFSGRTVDVINGKVGSISRDWYFQNKIDNSLWIYELSRYIEEEVSAEETYI